MNKTLKLLLNKYGTEAVISRILEQLKILAQCEDEEVTKTVKELLEDTDCDTEYIYNLCEYSNLVTYLSEDIKITNSPWNDKAGKCEMRKNPFRN
jgi:hypothetical protein